MKTFQTKKPAVALRGVQIDFKGMPPTPQRLLELLDVFKAARFNVVLTEWEDTFPWRDREMRSPTAYTPEIIRAFMKKAGSLGIEVIPLVQCLGHSEFILRWGKYRHLREVAKDASEYCASKPESAQTVMGLVDEMLDLMGESVRRFHLGGDEAWRMGSCAKCRATIKKGGKDGLYLGHVGPVLDHLRNRGVRPILWDDMMRSWPVPALKSIGGRADLMAWSYSTDPFDPKMAHLREKHISGFRKAGVKVWGASAYKGGDGAFDDRPHLSDRNANNLVWTRTAKKHGLVGVIATAWGRYNTFMSPCESIESSIDALVLTAMIMWNGRVPDEPEKAVRDFLGRVRGGRDLRNFEKCMKSASALVSWQTWDMRWTLELLERAAFLNGEPDRWNPVFWFGTVANTKKYLKNGRKIGADFIRSHHGLVPDRWNRLYVESRLQPIERRARAVMGKGLRNK